MPGFGRQVLSGTGRQVMVTADGAPEWKTGGVTIDWASVAAVSGADVTYADDTVVKIGQKGLRYGQVLCKITQRETQTVTITGTPTGGTFTLTHDGETTGPIAYNATAAAVQAALEALDNLAPGDVTVSGGPGPGTAFTVTFAAAENVAQMTADDDLLTGGSSPAVAVATTVQGVASQGKYGPYDSAATDGRQTLARGQCFILNETVLENGPLPGLTAPPSDHPAVLEGGVVWRARLLATTGTASLAAGPTFTALEAALPRLRYADHG